MSSSKSNIQYCAVVLLLSLCLIEQASARICYVCDSDIDVDCISRPNQDKFARICTPSYSMNANSTFLGGSNIKDGVEPRAIAYDCASAIGVSTQDGHTRVVRGCSVQAVTCATYQIIYAASFKLQVNKCLRCNADSCNFRN